LSVKIDVQQAENATASDLTSLIHRLTALHYAAKYGNVKVVELLLNGGAAVDVAGDEQQWTPLHMTAKYCRPLANAHKCASSTAASVPTPARLSKKLARTLLRKCKLDSTSEALLQW
uniref:ANK_REP_REGION domain-containing protein n=1 Tax=Heligmosomoides polygyrus TaxID=6339 RepID=A0A183FAW3_HELPZ